jgi:hypothetical protein
MIYLGKWRWPVLTFLPCAAAAGVFLLGGAVLDYRADVQLVKGKVTTRLTGEGRTPSAAVRSAEKKAQAFIAESLNKRKSALQKQVAAIEKRRTAISSQLNALTAQRQTALKGKRSSWTPEMAQQLVRIKTRHRLLASSYPTHTDIPQLAAQIKSLEARQGGRSDVSRADVSALSKKVNEARVEAGVLSARKKGLEAQAQRLQPDWRMVRPAVQPRWPISVPGWPVAAGTALGALLFGVFLIRGQKKAAFQADPITLELAKETPSALPDDPLSRQAASFYDRWLTLVQAVYAPGEEPPKNVFKDADALVKETAAFLPEGDDALTRYLARVVIPGDLPAHVTRTVLMALIGSYEAGASPEQRQGMTFAALFHDLAVAPRPSHAWPEIGSEVGRLSTVVLPKIPGLPAPLRTSIEEILVGMDEYALATWHNVSRSPKVEPFAKLLRHIDRFDKTLQKQKTRLTRRLASAA